MTLAQPFHPITPRRPSLDAKSGIRPLWSSGSDASAPHAAPRGTEYLHVAARGVFLVVIVAVVGWNGGKDDDGFVFMDLIHLG